MKESEAVSAELVCGLSTVVACEDSSLPIEAEAVLPNSVLNPLVGVPLVVGSARELLPPVLCPNKVLTGEILDPIAEPVYESDDPKGAGIVDVNAESVPKVGRLDGKRPKVR
ncbi:hypothetical protein RRF57_002645 [Xylaria bambusicola]|uniref:Uncharacterized protein n=1 Tax=Xylaria bambusicola TaxID=326684 RepID=A0AAN7YVS4_9PEZI